MRRARVDGAAGKWLANGAREGWAEPVNSRVVLGQDPWHAGRQSGETQQAGGPCSDNLYESAMFPLLAQSSGQPGSCAVCLPTLRFRSACRSQCIVQRQGEGIGRLREGDYETVETRKRVAFGREKQNTTGGPPADACEGVSPHPEHRIERSQQPDNVGQEPHSART